MAALYESRGGGRHRQDGVRGLRGSRPAVLAVEAGQKALADAHVSPSQVEAFYLGNFAAPAFVGQNHVAPYIASGLGLRCRPLHPL